MMGVKEILQSESFIDVWTDGQHLLFLFPEVVDMRKEADVTDATRDSLTSVCVLLL